MTKREQQLLELCKALYTDLVWLQRFPGAARQEKVRNEFRALLKEYKKVIWPSPSGENGETQQT